MLYSINFNPSHTQYIYIIGDEAVAFDTAIPATTTRKEMVPTGMGLPIMRPVMKTSELEVWTLRVRCFVCFFWGGNIYYIIDYILYYLRTHILTPSKPHTTQLNTM